MKTRFGMARAGLAASIVFGAGPRALAQTVVSNATPVVSSGVHRFQVSEDGIATGRESGNDSGFEPAEPQSPFDEPIETDRHDFTQSSKVVGCGVRQLEYGFFIQPGRMKLSGKRRIRHRN
jgi:hypothetical protein